MSAALTAAMRARDPETVSALPSALARLPNAEAVHIDTRPRAGAVRAQSAVLRRVLADQR